MKMDKKTMLVVVGCLIALFGWQTLINRIYPPKPKATSTGRGHQCPAASGGWEARRKTGRTGKGHGGNRGGIRGTATGRADGHAQQ